jgi:hypothetical protein
MPIPCFENTRPLRMHQATDDKQPLAKITVGVIVSIAARPGKGFTLHFKDK